MRRKGFFEGRTRMRVPTVIGKGTIGSIKLHTLISVPKRGCCTKTGEKTQSSRSALFPMRDQRHDSERRDYDRSTRSSGRRRASSSQACSSDTEKRASSFRVRTSRRAAPSGLSPRRVPRLHRRAGRRALDPAAGGPSSSDVARRAGAAQAHPTYDGHRTCLAECLRPATSWISCKMASAFAR